MREKLTLILFKDHLTARTVKLPLQWLPRLGLLWLIAMFVTFGAGLLLIRAYWNGSDGGGFAMMRSQSKIDDLEKQVAELKSTNDSLQSRGGQEGAPTDGNLERTAGNFLALPPLSTRPGLPSRESLPFRLENLKAQWRGNTLQITTAIEYIRDDGGNQQGHFVIFARGPQNIYAYPDGALSPAGAEVLVRPEAGEYFSVSRYREIKADFGPASTRDSIQSIELYLFDTQKRLIFVERSGVEAAKTKLAPSAPKTPTAETAAPPATESAAPPATPPASENPAPAAPGEPL